MRRIWAVVLAACFLCGSLVGCGSQAVWRETPAGQVVEIPTPTPTSVPTPAETPSLADAVQQVAEAMLPSEPEEAEATPTDAPALPEIDLESPMVALTFDDGPLSGSTDRILNILEQNGVVATFFIQGKQAALYPELVARAYGLGCQIGNHTYNHKDLTALNDQDALQQIESVNELVMQITGAGCSLVRPPHGKGWRDSRVLELVTYPLIMWSIDTKDWSTRNPTKTIAAVLDVVKDGDIILMHDVYTETADAAEKIIPELIARGYKLVTVSEMFSYKGLELSAGHAYRHAG